MPFTDPPAVHGVVESILYVENVPAAAAFFAEVLGLKALQGDGTRFQALDAGGRGVLLLFKRGGTLTPQPVPTGGCIPPHDGSGPHHIAFAIDDATYPQWLSCLQGRGIAIESETRWERGGRSIYFRDPDGHLVDVQQRRHQQLVVCRSLRQWSLRVAVSTSGTGDRVMTSPDGFTWTPRVSASDNDWRSVTYGNGLFVAVAQTGTGNRVMTSPDGITWTSRTSAADYNWLEVRATAVASSSLSLAPMGF
jgi:catechol 2,3-dioxygenase-like lactoylglutathione lyase family enzyme